MPPGLDIPSIMVRDTGRPPGGDAKVHSNVAAPAVDARYRTVCARPARKGLISSMYLFGGK
jgi:hypothetical protein